MLPSFYSGGMTATISALPRFVIDFFEAIAQLGNELLALPPIGHPPKLTLDDVSGCYASLHDAISALPRSVRSVPGAVVGADGGA